MQELHADKDFFDWLRRISSEYGDAMAAWGQEVHDAAAGNGGAGVSQQLLDATDRAVERLVQALIAIGRRHEDSDNPRGGEHVIEALERLIGASAELLRDARAGLERQGLAAIAGLSPRIGELRALEANVEQQTEKLQGRLDDAFGDPGRP